jgi:uncharacterized protein YkuJ
MKRATPKEARMDDRMQPGHALKSLQEQINHRHAWMLSQDFPYVPIDLYLSTHYGKSVALWLYYPVCRTMAALISSMQSLYMDASAKKRRERFYAMAESVVIKEMKRLSRHERNLQVLFERHGDSVIEMCYSKPERIELRGTDRVSMGIAEYIDVMDRVLQMADRLWFSGLLSSEDRNEIVVDIKKSVKKLGRFRWRENYKPRENKAQADGVMALQAHG